VFLALYLPENRNICITGAIKADQAFFKPDLVGATVERQIVAEVFGPANLIHFTTRKEPKVFTGSSFCRNSRAGTHGRSRRYHISRHRVHG
jgi:hypothetical protein